MNKTIFFDLGNVLLFFSHDKMCQQIADFCHFDKEKIHDLVFTQGMGEKYERGVINTHEVYEHFCTLTQKKLNFEGLMLAVSDIFVPNTAIVPLIKDLKKNDIRLIILSNTCEAHFDFIYTHFPVVHLFDAYILSHEVGARKPEHKIYEKAMAAANCSAQNCFYIDDIEEYIKSAQAYGIAGEAFTSVESLRQHLVARNFLQKNLYDSG